MHNVVQNIRYALRQMRKSPGFTAVAVITLALGIGANTAIFTLVHAVLLRSLPAAEPKQLYRLGDNDNCCVWGGHQDDFGIFSYALYRNLKDQTPEFEQMAAFQAATSRFGVRRNQSSDVAVPLVGEFVSGNYFSTFGVPAFAGRTLAPSDDAPEAAPAAMLSYRAWRDRYGLDRSAVGASFSINGSQFTVVGVAPPGFYGDTLRSDPPDLFIPLSQEPAIAGQQSLLNHAELHWLYIIGRMRRGITPSIVEPKLQVQIRQWLADQSGSALSEMQKANLAHTTLRLSPGGAGVTSLRDHSIKQLRLLIAVAALVLVIACANIANLQLARGTGNRQQTSIRLALGASRSRLVEQTLTESVLLSVIGGGAGLLVAFAGTRTILALAFQGSHYIPIDPSPSLPVLAFAFAMSLLTGIAFGVAPIWLASHFQPSEALRGANRSTRDRSSLPQRSLVVVQGALSLLLLVGAGLLLRSLHSLEDQRFGFETQGRLVVSVDPSLAGYKLERLASLYQQIEERVGQLPGVASVSYSMYSPLEGNRWSNDVLFEDGRTRAKQGEEDYMAWDRVGPHYFETLGTAVLRGRAIDERDAPSSRHVAVVNWTFAQRYFSNEDPIGKRFGLLPQHRGDYEIVGVVEDSKYTNARESAEPMAFLPFFQIVNYTEPEFRSGEFRSNYIDGVELRVTASAENIVPLVRRTLASIDPNLPVTEIRTLDEQVSRTFNQERLTARLTGFFGMLALVLASVGLYGVTAYSVARRTNEIGVRMALGADRNGVVAMVLREAFLQVGIGIGIGVPVALACARILAAELYGVKSYDPIVFVIAGLLLSACAFVAGFVPARRGGEG